jgi:leucyl aminopeptidase/proline iminopeptidase
VALGTLLAISRAKLPVEVHCWLAIAENHIGPQAFRPGEVVTALNGTTIEVVDTDAEGRMVLADALTLAAGDNPDLLIDYATLTGACKRALGSRYSGAFTNRPEWLTTLIALGQQSGERVWPFPWTRITMTTSIASGPICYSARRAPPRITSMPPVFSRASCPPSFPGCTST